MQLARLIAFTLFACIQWLQPVTAAAQTRIELWHGFSGLREEALTRLARDFNESQKAYVVEARYRAPQQNPVSALLSAQKTGAAPHLVQLDQAASSLLATHHTAFRPAQLVMQAAGHPINPNRYLPGLLDTYKDGLGRIMALPLGAASVAFYINTDILAKAGLPPDDTPKNWQDVRDIALKIIDTEASACAFTVDRFTWVMVENVLALHGESYTEQSGPFSHTSSVSFNNRLMMRHVGMISSWAKSGLFSYFGPRDESSERFAAGECAMLAGSSSAFPRLRDALGSNVRMIPLPRYEDIIVPDARTLLSGSGLWVLAGKKAPDYRGVGLFLAFLSRPEVQARWHESTGDIPMTRDAHDMTRKSGFYERNPWAEIPIRSTQSTGRPRPRMQQLSQIGRLREILDEELESVWAQQRTPMEALEAASERGTKLLRGK
jgi:sn-glycerol 3-phosphate transport system substrate-binding protein